MLKGQLIHPEISGSNLAAQDTVQDLDRGWELPVSDQARPARPPGESELDAGLVDCVQALRALISAVPVEDAAVMQYATTVRTPCIRIPRSGLTSVGAQRCGLQADAPIRSNGSRSTRPPAHPTWR